MNKHTVGNKGEKEVIALIRCPNCDKYLMTLPPNYPLYDIQCTGCAFRAQIKTNRHKPKPKVLGAGWTIIEKVLKSGFTVPPLIVNFKWKERGIRKREIRFYPFIPKSTLEHYQLSKKARRPEYKMFRYTKLDELPHFVLYPKGKISNRK